MPEDRRERIKPGPVAPYMQIADDIRRDVESGSLQTGDQLPALTELVERYGVNRITVRKSIRRLVEDGLLVVSVGRGTFVA